MLWIPPVFKNTIFKKILAGAKPGGVRAVPGKFCRAGAYSGRKKAACILCIGDLCGTIDKNCAPASRPGGVRSGRRWLCQALRQWLPGGIAAVQAGGQEARFAAGFSPRAPPHDAMDAAPLLRRVPTNNDFLEMNVWVNILAPTASAGKPTST